MGTNFYVNKFEKGNGICPKCGGDDVYLVGEDIKCIECNYTGPNEGVFNKAEGIHIGKRSAGWQFLFTPVFKTGKEWKEFIMQNGNNIFDEYDRKIEVKDMLKIVETQGINGKTATREHYGDYRWEDNEFFDSDGYRISKHKDFC